MRWMSGRYRLLDHRMTFFDYLTLVTVLDFDNTLVWFLQLDFLCFLSLFHGSRELPFKLYHATFVHNISLTVNMFTDAWTYRDKISGFLPLLWTQKCFFVCISDSILAPVTLCRPDRFRSTCVAFWLAFHSACIWPVTFQGRLIVVKKNVLPRWIGVLYTYQ